MERLEDFVWRHTPAILITGAVASTALTIYANWGVHCQ